MSKRFRWWHLLQISFRLLRLRFTHNELNHQLAKQAIADQLSDLGGIAMKIGQVVADIGNADELRGLLDKENARPLSEMLPLLEQELDQAVDDIFLSIEESTSAASLGQVHKARLKNGQTVAVKIQYPYISDAVESELKLAGLMPGLGPVKKWGMDLNAYKQTLASNMRRELDYRSEAARQQYLAQRIQVDGLVIPMIYPEFNTQRVLVQSWEEGKLLDQILDWPKVDRLLIARTLLLTLFQSIFKVGEVHGDPHMGNAFYRRGQNGKPEVVLLDYGCTIHIEDNARLALLQLIIETREGHYKNILANFSAMDFDPHKLAHIARELPLLAQILFKPFLLVEPFQSDKWRIKNTFDQLLGEKKWWFRSAGPADLFLLMRAFQGIVRQLERLQVSLPWWPILTQAIGEDVLRDARSFSPPDLPSDMPIASSELDSIAHSLRIRVLKHQETIIDMTLPAQAALELKEIMPDDIRKKVTSETTFDFQQLNQTLLTTQFKPGEILSFEKEEKKYKIWLE